MTESHLRSRLVVPMLKRLGRDPISVENPAYPGTPDVNYADGWIELKQLEEWPVHENTIVRIPHFTPQQRVWLRRRWLVSKNAWLLVIVYRDWLLYTGAAAFKFVGKVPKRELLQVAFRHWIGQPTDSDFASALEIPYGKEDSETHGVAPHQG